MRIKVRAVGVALAAAVGILAFSGAAQAMSNVGNSGLVNTDAINLLNVQGCNSPVNAAIGVTADVVSPRTIDDCVNAGGQVGGTTNDTSNVGNSGLVNTGKVNAGNVQLCNSPVNVGIAGTAQLASPYTVDNCVNSGATVGATDLGGDSNVGNSGLIANLGDVNGANAQLCNNPVNGVIGLTVPVGSPSTVDECVNSGAHVPGTTDQYKALKHTSAKPVPTKATVKATATKAKPAKATATKAKPAKVKPSKKTKHTHAKKH